MTRRSGTAAVLAVLAALTGARVATQQLPPGYLDPGPILDAATLYNRDVLNYAQRTLEPDMVSLWPPTELAEGYYAEAIRENFIISDGARQLSVHYLNPLDHVEGMLFAYLPGERLLLEADVVGTDRPRSSAPTRDQTTFYNLVSRLGLEVAQIVPAHGSPIPWSEFARAFAPRTN